MEAHGTWQRRTITTILKWIENGVYAGCIRALSKVFFYLLQDGYRLITRLVIAVTFVRPVGKTTSIGQYAPEY